MFLYLSITNLWILFLPSGGGINFSEIGGCKITDYTTSKFRYMFKHFRPFPLKPHRKNRRALSLSAFIA